MEAANIARDAFHTTFKDLLANGQYSDLVITCHGDTYNVHKAIVCSRSGFFERADRFPGKEHEEGKVDLPEDDPRAINALVQYLYEGEYNPHLQDDEDLEASRPVPDNKNNTFHYQFPHTCVGSYCHSPYCNVCPHHTCLSSTCKDSCENFTCRKCTDYKAPDHEAWQLLLHSQMYELGDKYQVVGLKDLAAEKFSRSCRKYWNDKEFPEAVHHAFTTTMECDMGLRQPATDIIAKHMELLNKAEMTVLIHKVNGLAASLLELRAKDVGWIKLVNGTQV